MTSSCGDGQAILVWYILVYFGTSAPGLFQVSRIYIILYIMCLVHVLANPVSNYQIDCVNQGGSVWANSVQPVLEG